MSALQKATHHLQPCTIFTPQSLPNWRTNFPDVVIFQFGITIDKTKCLVSILHKHLLTIFLQNRYNFWKINYTNFTLPIWCIFYCVLPIFYKHRNHHHILWKWRIYFCAFIASQAQGLRRPFRRCAWLVDKFKVFVIVSLGGGVFLCNIFNAAGTGSATCFLKVGYHHIEHVFEKN